MSLRRWLGMVGILLSTGLVSADDAIQSRSRHRVGPASLSQQRALGDYTALQSTEGSVFVFRAANSSDPANPEISFFHGRTLGLLAFEGPVDEALHGLHRLDVDPAPFTGGSAYLRTFPAIADSRRAPSDVWSPATGDHLERAFLTGPAALPLRQLNAAAPPPCEDAHGQVRQATALLRGQGVAEFFQRHRAVAALIADDGCDGGDDDDDHDDDEEEDDPDDDENDPENPCGGQQDAGDGLHVHLTTGNVWTRVPVLQTYAAGEVELDVVLRYDSMRTADASAGLGPGWTHNYHIFVSEKEYDIPGGQLRKAIFVDGAGRRHAFWQKCLSGQQCQEFEPPPGRALDIAWLSDHYEIERSDGSVLVFNASNRISEIIDSRGRTTRFAYGLDNRLIALNSPHGREVALAYDAEGRLQSISGPDQTVTRLEYANGRLVRIIDPLMNAIEYAYDADHRITSETLRNGSSYTAEYGVAPDRRTLRDSAGNIVAQVISAMGFPTTRSDTMLWSVIDYMDGRGENWKVTRDPLGRVREFRTPQQGPERVYKYGSHLNSKLRNRLIWVSNELGHKQYTYYDIRGNVRARVDEEGHFEQFKYDHPIKNLVTRHIEPDGDEWLYNYAANGDVMQVVDPLIESPTDAISTFNYDSHDEMAGVPPGGAPLPGRIKRITQTDRNGNVVLLDYDTSGNLTAVTRDPSALITTL